MEKITYLLANYNNGDYIADCLESLNDQASDDWLCIICDDASTDDSLSVIDGYLSENILLLRNEVNVGYIRTLKRLIENATTDVVGILDPDDALSPKATQEVLEAYVKHPECGFIYTDYQKYDEFLNVMIYSASCSDKRNDKTALIYGCVSHLKTFKRSDYFKTLMYDEDMLYAEDRDLCYKMEEVTDFFYINKKLYKYRDVPNSQSSGEKFFLGVENHVKARENALVRRGVGGFDLFLHYVINFFLIFSRGRFSLVSSLLKHVIRWAGHSSGRI